MTDHECSTCKHSRLEDTTAGRLYCHRYARRVSDKQWPIVQADDLCGDFELNQVDQNKIDAADSAAGWAHWRRMNAWAKTLPN